MIYLINFLANQCLQRREKKTEDAQSNMKKPPSEIDLILDCEVEDLTEEQNDYYERHERHYEEVKKKIGIFMNNCSNVIEASNEISVLECHLNNG